jgi:DNA-binding CsgD family transcriptional regulator
MAVVAEDTLFATVDRIYEAVERPELWPQTIYNIGELIGGRRNFWGSDQDPRQIPHDSPMRNLHESEIGCHGTFFLSRMDLQILDEYAGEFGELIIRFLKIVFLSSLRSQNNVRAREAIGLKIAQRYLEAVEPLQGISASLPSKLAGRKLIAALWEDGCVFGSDNLHSMRLLAPHLDRALRLQTRLSLADLQADMKSGALDCLAHGVVLLARSGQPLWLNKRAKETTNGSGVLRLSSTGLAAKRSADTRSLREIIEGAVSAGTQGILAIGRGDDLRPLLLTAIPLKPIGSSDAADQSACGAVFITDPDRTDNPTVEPLRRAFNLTYREAQMAIAIAHGHGLQAAADSMGVALTTARSQLQQAFAKTGTKHQAELAVLVQRTLAHLRYD